MVSYILVGLDIEYNPVVSAAVARVEPISVNELYGQLLSFESRQVMLQGSSSNMLSHHEIPISECEPFSSINLNF
jgi:hypothetical protein